MNPLDRYPSIRAALYMVQWVVNGILTIAGVIFVTRGVPVESLPEWYIIALAVAPVLWTYLGVTAQSNTRDPGGSSMPTTIVVNESASAQATAAEVARVQEQRILGKAFTGGTFSQAEEAARKDPHRP